MTEQPSTPRPRAVVFPWLVILAVVVLAAACGASSEETSADGDDSSTATATPTATATETATQAPTAEAAEPSAEASVETSDTPEAATSTLDAVIAEFESWALFNNAPGAVFAVIQGDAAAEVAYGVTDLTAGSPITTESNFRIASVTKTVTSAVILQLVDEGLVDLDEPVSAYIPEWAAAAEAAGADGITVRQLLQHTSGFADYAVDPVFYLKVLSRLDVAIEPEEIVDFSLDQGLLFEPGSDYNYSTTNYVIAGLLIEALTGNPAHVEFQNRIFEPLGLEGLFLTPAEFPSVPVVNGYIDGRDGGSDSDGAGLAELLGAAAAVFPEESVIQMGDDILIDVAALPQELLTSVAWTGGGLEGNVAETVRLLPGYFNSGMLSDESITELETASEHHNRSVGLNIDERPGYTIYSHGGTVPGFRAGVAYIPELELSLAVLVSSMPLASDVTDLFESVAKLVADSTD